MSQDINHVSKIYPNVARRVGRRRIAAHMRAPTWLVLTSLALPLSLLGACGSREEAPAPKRADWVLQSKVQFFEADAKTPRATPQEDLRLWVPYVVGDLYGAPNAGELAPVTLKPDMSFSLDLNKSHEKLALALVPTEFSQKWMMIEPREARVARHSPWVMPADGIAPLGRTEWLDTDTGTRLLLIYVDRPARIRGEIVYECRSLNFDIDAKQAGYLWVTQPETSGEYKVVPRPAHLVLAVM